MKRGLLSTAGSTVIISSLVSVANLVQPAKCFQVQYKIIMVKHVTRQHSNVKTPALAEIKTSELRAMQSGGVWSRSEEDHC